MQSGANYKVKLLTLQFALDFVRTTFFWKKTFISKSGIRPYHRVREEGTSLDGRLKMYKCIHRAERPKRRDVKRSVDAVQRAKFIMGNLRTYSLVYLRNLQYAGTGTVQQIFYLHSEFIQSETNLFSLTSLAASFYELNISQDYLAINSRTLTI